MLGDVSDQIEQTIAVVFENYKSLDESSPSGVADVFTPATGFAASALIPALKLYKLLHDILSSEAQLKLCRYFQVLNAYILSFPAALHFINHFFLADCSEEEIQEAYVRNR